LQVSNPVFVVGTLRSGTSLLYSLLNQHPQIALMYECNVWDFPETFSKPRFRGNWLERQEFYNQALSRHRLIWGRSLRGMENVGTPEELYRSFGEGKGAALWGEKSPFYCARLRQLTKRYPGCSFILVWRDPVETYRSVMHAGRKSLFFRRRGMLSRLIFYQEQMIQQVAELSRAGVRVHHVSYDDLIHKTETVCRGISQFLGVEFDATMLNLSGADFSAVPRGAHHDHLRRGVIERQQFAEELVGPSIERKLNRFRTRWNRLSNQWLGNQENAVTDPEPSLRERLYHRMAGLLLYTVDDAKRIFFEFMPLPWLQSYRQLKEWYMAARTRWPEERRSLLDRFRTHWITILASWAMIAAVAPLHFYRPHLTFMPFYLVPCAFLTLIINRRWGLFAAIFSAGIGPALQRLADPDYASFSVFVWNFAMRFFLFVVVLLLLDRIAVENRTAKSDSA
jgi:hypothetical protein